MQSRFPPPPSLLWCLTNAIGHAHYVTSFAALYHFTFPPISPSHYILMYRCAHLHMDTDKQTCTDMHTHASVCMYVWVGSYLFVHLPDVVILNWENNKATRIFTQQRLQRRVKWCCDLVHNCASFLGAVVLIFGCNRHFANVTNVLRQNFLAGALHGKTKADI